MCSRGADDQVAQNPIQPVYPGTIPFLLEMQINLLCCHHVCVRIPDLKAVLQLPSALFQRVSVLFELSFAPSSRAVFAVTSAEYEEVRNEDKGYF